MSALVLAAALALAPATQPPGGCPRINVAQAAAPPGLGAHPLGQEPLARYMHAVLRKVENCVIVDVSVVRAGGRVWEYQPVGPAIGQPVAASLGR
jgi:hypothetical protein